MAIIFAIIAAVAIVAFGIVFRWLYIERATSEALALALEEKDRQLDKEITLRKATRLDLTKARYAVGKKRREAIWANVFLTELIEQNPTLEFRVDRKRAKELFLR